MLFHHLFLSQSFEHEAAQSVYASENDAEIAAEIKQTKDEWAQEAEERKHHTKWIELENSIQLPASRTETVHLFLSGWKWLRDDNNANEVSLCVLGRRYRADIKHCCARCWQWWKAECSSWNMNVY